MITWDLTIYTKSPLWKRLLLTYSAGNNILILRLHSKGKK